MKFTKREKSLLILAAALGIFTIFYFIVTRASRSLTNTNTVISEKKREEAEINKYGQLYQNLRSQSMADIGTTQNVVVFVEESLKNLQLADKANITPSQTETKEGFEKKLVKIRFSNIEIKPVLEFIKIIENNTTSLFIVESASFRASVRQKGLYFVYLDIAGYQKSEPNT